MDKSITLIKLGGSIITDKSRPYTANFDIINKLAKEIKEIREEECLNLIVGHGAGSFAHTSANKYKTASGFINKGSKYGFCFVQNDASKLNRIIVESFINNKEKAISIQASACCIANNSKIIKFYLEPIKKIIEYDMLPIVYGDVGIDLGKGSCILSAENLLCHLAKELLAEYKINIIMVGKIDGVFTSDPNNDKNAKLIKEINKDNWEQIKNHVGKSDCVDVTGGMLHKVESLLDVAKIGIESQLISANIDNNLKKAIKGEYVKGTKIKW